MRGSLGNANGRRGRPRKDGLPHGAAIEVVKPPKSPSKRNGGFLDKENPITLARTLAAQHVEMAINTLVEVCSNKTTNVIARVRAATELLDRGYGKPHLMLEQKELPPTTQVKISFGENSQPILLPPIIDGHDVDN